jgi:hypothetical protein
MYADSQSAYFIISDLPIITFPFRANRSGGLSKLYGYNWFIPICSWRDNSFYIRKLESGIIIKESLKWTDLRNKNNKHSPFFFFSFDWKGGHLFWWKPWQLALHLVTRVAQREIFEKYL